MKGDFTNTSKITYYKICINTKICVCFRSMMMTMKAKNLRTMTKSEDDGEIFADISDWTNKKSLQVLINHSCLAPVNYGTLFRASYGGWESIESELAVAPLFFKINLYSNPSKISYKIFLLSQAKWLRHLIFFFLTHKSLA